MSSSLIAPHGGELVDLLVSEERAESLKTNPSNLNPGH